MYSIILANLFAILILQVSSIKCGPRTVLHPNGTNCFDCAKGYNCPDSHNINEIPTPAGSWQGVLCSEGFFQPLPAQFLCWLCPRGHYCGNGTIKPMKCPRGTYANYYGESSCEYRTIG
jgi:hypothetical protein